MSAAKRHHINHGDKLPGKKASLTGNGQLRNRGSNSYRVHGSRMSSAEEGQRDCKEPPMKIQKKKDHKAEVQRIAEKVCGDWSEHVSSSGKRYYYNCKTEVSQWEKPGGWIVSSIEETDGIHSTKVRPKQNKDEMRHSSSVRNESKIVDNSSNSHDWQSAASDAMHADSKKSSSSTHTKHRASTDGALENRELESNSEFWESPLNNRHGPARCNSSPRHRDGYGYPSRGGERNWVNPDGNRERRKRSWTESNSREHNDDVTCEDMEISPGNSPLLDRTPLMENSVDFTNASQSQSTSLVGSSSAMFSINATLTSSLSSPRSDSGLFASHETVAKTLAALQQTLIQTVADKNASSPVVGCSPRPHSSTYNGSLTTLLVLINQLLSEQPSQRKDWHQIAQKAIQLLQMLQQQVLAAQQQRVHQHQLQQTLMLLMQLQKKDQIPSTGSTPPKKSLAETRTTAAERDESPYSPSDSDELLKPDEYDEHLRRAMANAEHSCDNSSEEKSRLCSPVHDVNNSQMNAINTSQLTGGSVLWRHNTLAAITPSLVNYFNEGLTQHMVGWPAAVVEKQADRLNEEGYVIGSIHCARVCMELKQMRCNIRHNEIHTTLQEHRAMFLSDQIKELEKNCYLYLPSHDA